LIGLSSDLLSTILRLWVWGLGVGRAVSIG